MQDHRTNGRPDAAAGFDRTTQDIGNIVEFGHVNLRVPDQQLAIAFYVMGLGLTRDPFERVGLDNAWINVGASQFHLPTGVAQRWRGVIGLALPDLDALLARLDGVATHLRGTRFVFTRAANHVDVCCPWGNHFRVQQDAALRLGIPYVQVDCAPGTAARIGRFYAKVLGALTTVGDDAGAPFVRVAAGVAGSLLFCESAQPLPPYDGHHVQIGVADFSGVHSRLQQRGLVSEESNASQYRFERIVDIDSGETLATLEHEVRSMRHPGYGRVLVNRPC